MHNCIRFRGSSVSRHRWSARMGSALSSYRGMCTGFRGLAKRATATRVHVRVELSCGVCDSPHHSLKGKVRSRTPTTATALLYCKTARHKMHETCPHRWSAHLSCPWKVFQVVHNPRPWEQCHVDKDSVQSACFVAYARLSLGHDFQLPPAVTTTSYVSSVLVAATNWGTEQQLIRSV